MQPRRPATLEEIKNVNNTDITKFNILSFLNIPADKQAAWSKLPNDKYAHKLKIQAGTLFHPDKHEKSDVEAATSAFNKICNAIDYFILSVGTLSFNTSKQVDPRDTLDNKLPLITACRHALLTAAKCSINNQDTAAVRRAMKIFTAMLFNKYQQMGMRDKTVLDNYIELLFPEKTQSSKLEDIAAGCTISALENYTEFLSKLAEKYPELPRPNSLNAQTKPSSIPVSSFAAGQDNEREAKLRLFRLSREMLLSMVRSIGASLDMLPKALFEELRKARFMTNLECSEMKAFYKMFFEDHEGTTIKERADKLTIEMLGYAFKEIHALKTELEKRLNFRRTMVMNLITASRAVLLDLTQCTDNDNDDKFSAALEQFYKAGTMSAEEASKMIAYRIVFFGEHGTETVEDRANQIMFDSKTILSKLNTCLTEIKHLKEELVIRTSMHHQSPANQSSTPSSQPVSAHGLFAQQNIMPTTYQYDFNPKGDGRIHSGLHVLYDTADAASSVYKKLPAVSKQFINLQGGKIYIEESKSPTDGQGVYNNPRKQIVIHFPDNTRDTCLVLLGFSREIIAGKKNNSKTYSDQPNKIFFPTSMQGAGELISQLDLGIKYQFDFDHKAASCLYANFNTVEMAALAYGQLSPGCRKIMTLEAQSIKIQHSPARDGHGVYFNDTSSEIIINFPKKADVIACVDLLGLSAVPHYLRDKQQTKLYIKKSANHDVITQLTPTHQPTATSIKM